MAFGGLESAFFWSDVGSLSGISELVGGDGGGEDDFGVWKFFGGLD